LRSQGNALGDDATLRTQDVAGHPYEPVRLFHRSGKYGTSEDGIDAGGRLGVGAETLHQGLGEPATNRVIAGAGLEQDLLAPYTRRVKRLARKCERVIGCGAIPLSHPREQLAALERPAGRQGGQFLDALEVVFHHLTAAFGPGQLGIVQVPGNHAIAGTLANLVADGWKRLIGAIPDLAFQRPSVDRFARRHVPEETLAGKSGSCQHLSVAPECQTRYVHLSCGKGQRRRRGCRLSYLGRRP
jgi:hypothetical protein